MGAILSTAPLTLQALFGAADPLARQTGFVQRLRQLQPAAFARAFCLFLVRCPTASLRQLAAELNITASALSQRLLAPAAARFLSALLGAALDRLAAAALRPITIPLLRRFHGVYLVDGTGVPLPAALAHRFAGCGGGTGPGDPSGRAAVKILLRLRLDTGQAAEVLLDAARTPDVRMMQRLARLPAGALHIGDLGFFDGSAFAGLTRQGVYWLTRLPARVSVRPGGGDWRELAAWLRHLERRGIERFDGVAGLVRLTPVPARLLVLRCPAAEAARRRRKLRDRLRRKGKTAGRRQLTLCGWWALATNVPPEKLRASEAWELYRCRWQIELVFKRWKSLGGLAVDQRHAAIRAECELYGKLLGVLLVDWLALQRGGALAGKSPWQAWQTVLGLLPQICWALEGRIDWEPVGHELLLRLRKLRSQAKRKKRPSSRQRLFRATLAD
jgi:hypothetical protein